MNTNILEIKINSVQILKNLARNLETHFFEYVEEVGKLMLEKLITDPYAMTVRKEAAKCMRFCINACKEHPDKQRALYIMTYVRLLEELEKRRTRKEFDQVNSILKELHKMTNTFDHFKEKGLQVYIVDDAKTFIDRLVSVVKDIKEDKEARLKKVKTLSKHIDEEDMEFFEEDLEKIDKGIHHVMELSGFLLRNMGEAIAPHIQATLLPIYAQDLLNVSDKKTYELIDAVCFICDCMEHGGQALYGEISGQAGGKFLELIAAQKQKEEKSYDLIQSCIFGLGLIAQLQTNGQFTQLGDVLSLMPELCNPAIAETLKGDDKDSFLMMSDNALATLAKIVLF